jgi:hypothetical protein
MREIQKTLFNEMMDLVTENEIRILRIFDLPGIDVARGKEIPEQTFDMSIGDINNRLDRVRVILRRWLNDLTRGSNSPYVFNMRSAFALGLTETQKLIDKAKSIVNPLESEYYQQLIMEGLERISADLTIEHLNEIYQILVEGKAQLKSTAQVARDLHRHIGEGASWHWLRLAKSECVIASARAYDAQSDANGIEFDEWSAAPGACDICDALDGEVWRRGQGPSPVSDTHPHCGCVRIPLFFYDGETQRRWDRSSPYESGEGWNQDRVDNLREWLAGGNVGL